jgi:8-hydroxy-5-deazaflavin:NADPH oxidoreductase
MRIGIIGSGNIGGTVGRLWAKAGHEVLYASRHPEKLRALAEKTGGNARAGTSEEAARFGDAILLAVPYGALPTLGPALAPLLAGKLVLDAGNPYPGRDGEMAQQALASGEGAGVTTARHLPGARIVRAFNSVFWKTLESEAHRQGDRVGIPLAGDDAAAIEQAAALVRDAGFDPVRVGPLREAARFDVGTPVYNTGMSGPELRRALGVS